MQLFTVPSYQKSSHSGWCSRGYSLWGAKKLAQNICLRISHPLCGTETFLRLHQHPSWTIVSWSNYKRCSWCVHVRMCGANVRWAAAFSGELQSSVPLLWQFRSMILCYIAWDEWIRKSITGIVSGKGTLPSSPREPFRPRVITGKAHIPDAEISWVTAFFMDTPTAYFLFVDSRGVLPCITYDVNGPMHCTSQRVRVCHSPSWIRFADAHLESSVYIL